MKNLNKIFAVLIAVLFVTSCSTDFDEINSNHTNVIGFTLSATLELPLSENNPEINFPLPYFVSNSSTSERTFQVSVVEEESGLSPDSYSFDATVVVPANERSGQLVFNAYNINLTNEYTPLVLAFDSTSEIATGNKMYIALRTND
tara:strand:+ start:63280 stop:63717 length:438 start_codon:yes stop_codon:yes gene_type:complete